MATRKYIRKEQKKHILRQAGYKVFNVHGLQACEVYAILVIACNKLDKDKPERAYKNVSDCLRSASRGCSIKPDIWKKPEAGALVRADREGEL